MLKIERETTERIHYPFDKLKINEHFEVMESEGIKNYFNRVHCALYQWNRRHFGKKLTSRKIKGGIRIWRIE
jgi:hypothetical protein